MCCKADNTVREARSWYVMTWLHVQVLRGRFRSATLSMPRKSHSHDRIGWKMMERMIYRLLQIYSVQSFLTSAAHILHIRSCLSCADQLWGVLSRRLANCDAMLTDEAGTFTELLSSDNLLCIDSKASWKFILLSWQART